MIAMKTPSYIEQEMLKVAAESHIDIIDNPDPELVNALYGVMQEVGNHMQNNDIPLLSSETSIAEDKFMHKAENIEADNFWNMTYRKSHNGNYCTAVVFSKPKEGKAFGAVDIRERDSNDVSYFGFFCMLPDTTMWKYFHTRKAGVGSLNPDMGAFESAFSKKIDEYKPVIKSI